MPSRESWSEIIKRDATKNTQLRAGDLAGLQTRRADRDAPPVARGDKRPDPLHVWVPPTVRAAMRVRNGHAEAGPFAADIADAGHGGLLDLNVHRRRTSARPSAGQH